MKKDINIRIMGLGTVGGDYYKSSRTNSDIIKTRLYINYQRYKNINLVKFLA